MTKKHFQALADALLSVRPDKDRWEQPQPGYYDARQAWRESTNAIAIACSNNNPRFDRARFLKACGMEEGS